MQTHDRHYYQTRALQERRNADRCTDASARCVHLELAERYNRLARPLTPAI